MAANDLEPPRAPELSASDSPTEPAQAPIEPRIRLLCGRCHGREAVGNGNVQGGFSGVDDFDQLVSTGWVIPLDSAASPLVRIFEDGSMPPPGVEPRPTDDDVFLLISFIDNPRFWPEFTAPPAVDAGISPAWDAGAAAEPGAASP